MLVARLGGKITDADLDATAGAREPPVPDLALPDEPGQRARVVSCDSGGFGEVDNAVGLQAERALDCVGSPLERAGRALSAEGVSQLLGPGADVGDSLVNGAGFRSHEKTHPPRILRGVFVPVRDYAGVRPRKSRPDLRAPPRRPETHRAWSNRFSPSGRCACLGGVPDGRACSPVTQDRARRRRPLFVAISCQLLRPHRPSAICGSQLQHRRGRVPFPTACDHDRYMRGPVCPIRGVARPPSGRNVL